MVGLLLVYMGNVFVFSDGVPRAKQALQCGQEQATQVTRPLQQVSQIYLWLELPTRFRMQIPTAT